MNPNITQVICVNLAISYIIHEKSLFFPRELTIFPWFSDGFPMVFPWFSHGFHAPKKIPHSTELRGCWARRLHDSASRPGVVGASRLGLGRYIYIFIYIYIYILQVCNIYIWLYVYIYTYIGYIGYIWQIYIIHSPTKKGPNPNPN